MGFDHWPYDDGGWGGCPCGCGGECRLGNYCAGMVPIWVILWVRVGAWVAGVRRNFAETVFAWFL